MRKKYNQEDWYVKNKLKDNATEVKRRLNEAIESYKKLLKTENDELVDNILGNLF